MCSNLFVSVVEILKWPFQMKTSEQCRGLVSEETVVLRRWGSETRKFGLSTELICKLTTVQGLKS